VVEKIDVEASVLDVAFCKDIMYVSVDSGPSACVLRYRQNHGGGWEKVLCDNSFVFNGDVNANGAKIELYWLESMRKKFRGSDE